MNHVVIFNDNHEIKRRTSGAYRFANLMEDLGWQVTLVDWVSDWTDEELFTYLDQIITQDTILFGISYTWLDPTWCRNFVDKLRNRYPGRKYIAGGQQFYQHDIGADLALFGYSELAVQDSIDWLFGKGNLPNGACTPDNLGKMVLVDCNQHYPAMNLGDYSIYYQDDDYVQPEELLTVELSRGCKFKCKYCNYAFLGIKEDTSTCEDNLRQELINNYEKWGTHNYIIADDTLNDRNSKLEMLVNVVESLPFEVNFASFIRIDLVAANPKQIELLARARVWAHFYGIETFNRAAGRAVGKGMDPEKIKQALLDVEAYMLKTIGLYRGTVGMIAGLPHETIESWQDSENWLKANWSNNSWMWWPLEISKDKNTATLSTFSNDWEKHGYKEIVNPDRINAVRRMFATADEGVQHKFDANILFWTSDWANFAQAIQFVDNWYKTDAKKFQKMGSFHILNFYDQFSKKELLDLSEKYFLHSTFTKDQYQMFVEPYIQRKIQGCK